MNIRIQNLPPGVTVEEIREFIGASDEIEDILLSEAGNADNVIALIKVNTSQAGQAPWLNLSMVNSSSRGAFQPRLWDCYPNDLTHPFLSG